VGTFLPDSLDASTEVVAFYGSLVSATTGEPVAAGLLERGDQQLRVAARRH
jgi:hypothetical protein